MDRKDKAITIGGSMAAGAASGAATGSAIVPGWGTLIGGIVGLAGGAIGGAMKARGMKKQEEQYDIANRVEQDRWDKQYGLSKDELALRRDQLGIQRDQHALARSRLALEQTFGSQDRMRQWLERQPALRNEVVNLWGRRRVV